MNEVSERCNFRPGDCITEKFTIEKELGKDAELGKDKGAFGKVFLVKNRRNNQRYALKLFKFWELVPGERETMDARFKMEYETGQIKSNYLARSFESGYIRGNPYIVMEYCANGDLQTFVNTQNTVDLVKIGKEVLFGLKDLHRCGKVHRDLKPENVLIHDNGTAVLTDFGLSGDRKKRLTAVNYFGRPLEIAGTPAYMAWEQSEPKNNEVTVLPTMDIFAFGVMMYYLITKKYPFGELNNHNDLAIYFRNVKQGNWDQRLLSESPNGKKFEQAITGCLAADYRKRLPNVDAVLSLLPQDSYQAYVSGIIPPMVHGLLLRIMQGEEHGAAYKLNELIQGKCKIITIGRRDPSGKNIVDITENFSSYVSRKHCTLEVDSKKWYIRDGQCVAYKRDGQCVKEWKPSMNGTFVNASEVPQTGMPIHLGDIITIGDVKLRVEGY